MARKKTMDENTVPGTPAMGEAAESSVIFESTGASSGRESAPKSASAETVTIGKNVLYGGIIGILIVLLLASVFTGGFGFIKGSTPAGGGLTPAPSPAPGPTPAPAPAPSSLSTVQINEGSLPAWGNAAAPVSIIEFSDFQCPFCAKFYRDTGRILGAEYVNTGKVRFYYRDYPLVQLGHRYADDTAFAARCANDQGKFWEYHNKLFENQNSWASVSESEIAATLTGYATGLGLNGDTFAGCLKEQKHLQAVARDVEEGQTAFGGALGTPTFFVLIPKDKTSLGALTAVVTSSPYYAQGYVDLRQTDNAYVVLITGALPTATFKSVLDAVNY